MHILSFVVFSLSWSKFQVFSMSIIDCGLNSTVKSNIKV